MTPKEKAKELFDKLYFTDDPSGNYPISKTTAIQCLSIAVDEILEATYKINYWMEVKQEIEKL